MEYQELLLKHEGAVAVVTLNRPDVLNALSPRLMLEFVDVLETTAKDNGTRVLVVTGAGRGFCSGADLAALESGGLDSDQRWLNLEPVSYFGLIAKTLGQYDKPVIAAVNGVAAGAGFAITMGCDIRIASETARFSAIFVKRALAPDTGASYYLPRLVPMSRAAEMLLTGDLIDVQEAERIGLVSRIVPADQLLTSAMDLAGRIAAEAPLAVELAKKAMRRSLSNTLDAQLDYEGWAQGICLNSRDAQEGRRAFLEKRPPQYEGR
ncbi:MAG: enoyl-CoA hydratase/isomerase family protein [Chloroflexota bacterium]|nr:MAG: enoyl-CoA hydratase/isomerase family protein [Chloroflexota bacterium]